MHIRVARELRSGPASRAIEAWVIGPTDDRGKVRELQTKFLSEYGLNANDVPLIVYHADRDGSGDVFSL